MFALSGTRDEEPISKREGTALPRFEVVDSLAPYGRNESCWCMSGKKYKNCHGRLEFSGPGVPVPEDSVDGVHLSPTMVLAPGALKLPMSPDAAPVYMPSDEPQPSSVRYSELEAALPSLAPRVAMVPEDLGRLRVEVLRRLARLADDGTPLADDLIQAIAGLAAETLSTVDALSRVSTNPMRLWNDELTPTQFLSRTLLLADHLYIPDALVDAIAMAPTNSSVRSVAARLLEHAPLLENGSVIPIPNGVTLSLLGDDVVSTTAEDLRNPGLVRVVQSGFELEGPTAREALILHVRDDLDQQPGFWLYAHIDQKRVSREDNSFAARMLGRYDPKHDYTSWIKQVKDQATSMLIQRTNQRAITADLFGAQHVAASPFEARLLGAKQKRAIPQAAQAVIWADVPVLTDLSARDLAKILKSDEAVRALRESIETAVMHAKSDDLTDAVEQMSHDIERAAVKIEQDANLSRWLTVIGPLGFGTGAIALGAAGSLHGLAAGALGAVGSLLPYIEQRVKARREAAYVFVAARRAARK